MSIPMAVMLTAWLLPGVFFALHVDVRTRDGRPWARGERQILFAVLVLLWPTFVLANLLEDDD